MTTKPTFTIRRETADIDAAAAAAGMTRSQWVNRAIDYALAYETTGTATDEAVHGAIQALADGPVAPVVPLTVGSTPRAPDAPPARCPHRLTSVCDECAGKGRSAPRR